MRILLIGHGVMGRAVEALAPAAGHQIVGRVGEGDPPLVVTDATRAEVAIEFAGPVGAPVRIREAIAAGLPVVSGSTGWSEEFDAVAEEVRERGGAMLHAPNLSIGVALFERIVRRAAVLLDVVPDYELQLDETHHTRKLDHPSGTARWLADGVVEAVERLERWEGGLADAGAPPHSDRALPVRSFREGDVAGTHTLRATGPDDVIELTHRALRRDGFARGAIRAAEWLAGRTGVFTLDDMLDTLLDRPSGADAS